MGLSTSSWAMEAEEYVENITKARDGVNKIFGIDNSVKMIHFTGKLVDKRGSQWAKDKFDQCDYILELQQNFYNEIPEFLRAAQKESDQSQDYFHFDSDFFVAHHGVDHWFNFKPSIKQSKDEVTLKLKGSTRSSRLALRIPSNNAQTLTLKGFDLEGQRADSLVYEDDSIYSAECQNVSFEFY